MSAFLLFIAGEPFEIGVKVARTSNRTFWYRGGLSDPEGLDDPDYAVRDQTYGPQATIARMVSDLAARDGLDVKVVNVERPGDDLALVEASVRADTDLPLLVRPDGRRLEGAENFEPARVSKFLRLG